MEDIEFIINAYQSLNAKLDYLRRYVECMSEINEQSSQFLLSATSIPRDTLWNDNNLLAIVEMNDKQRNAFLEAYNLYKALKESLYVFTNQISDDMSMMKKDLFEVLKEKECRLHDIENCKDELISSWIKKKDPWIYDIKLKIAIRNMYSKKRSFTTQIVTKISIYKDKLLFTQSCYTRILEKIVSIQKKQYSSLIDTTNVRIQPDKYEYKQNTYEDETIESKILNLYESTIQKVTKELSNQNINTYQSIDAVYYAICKVKKGLTHDYTLVFAVITRSRFLHIFDIFTKENVITQKYSKLIAKLKYNASRNLLSIFDGKPSELNTNDENVLHKLTADVIGNIDRFINNVYHSIDIREKIVRLEKNNCIVTLADKNQTGIVSVFGVNTLKIKTRSRASCCEFFLCLQKKPDTMEHMTTETVSVTMKTKQVDNVRNEYTEENPWA